MTDLRRKMCAIIRAQCYYDVGQMKGRMYGRSAEKKKKPSCCQWLRRIDVRHLKALICHCQDALAEIRRVDQQEI